MTVLETKELMTKLASSDDFFQALATADSLAPEGSEEVTIMQLGVWFFSQGYISRMKFEEEKGSFISKPYKKPEVK